MTSELQVLVFAGLWGLMQLLISDYFTTKQRGLKWNLSSREGVVEPLHGVAGRMDRAFKNFLETFPFFMVGVVAVLLSQRTSSLSYWGAQIYLYARLLHFFIYAAGINGLRSVIWGFSLLGIFLVYASLL